MLECVYFERYERHGGEDLSPPLFHAVFSSPECSRYVRNAFAKSSDLRTHPPLTVANCERSANTMRT